MLFGRAPLNIERSLFVPLRSLFFGAQLKKLVAHLVGTETLGKLNNLHEE